MSGPLFLPDGCNLGRRKCINCEACRSCICLLGHIVYYYSFGTAGAFKRRFNHEQGAATDTLLKDDLDQGMRKSFALFTEKNSFMYRLVHSWRERHPWCIYVMYHEDTEPASKAKVDIFKGAVENAANDTLVSFRTPIPLKYQHLAARFDEALSLYSSVVPTEVLDKIVDGVSEHDRQLELLMQKFNSETIKKADVLEFITLARAGNLEIFKKVLNIKQQYQVNVTKEIQRNDFCYDLVNGILNKLGFACKKSLEHKKICLHGKSQMDFCFYKDVEHVVTASVIRKLEDDKIEVTRGKEGVVGGVTEFKNDAAPSHYGQVFADMVRVGANLTFDALLTGRLIEKICVYGLLVNYATRCAVIMKYYVNFATDETVFLVGREVDAVRGLIAIVEAMEK